MKALFIIFMFPLVLCLGVYACTAAHVAVLTH